MQLIVDFEVPVRQKEEAKRKFDKIIRNQVTLLLNKIEVYAIELIDKTTPKIIDSPLIVEKFDNNKRPFLYFLDQNKITEIEDIDILESISLEDNLMKFLQIKYQVNQLEKLPILSQLEYIRTISTSIFLIRHEELTRGREYIELIHLL